MLSVIKGAIFVADEGFVDFLFSKRYDFYKMCVDSLIFLDLREDNCRGRLGSRGTLGL